VARTVAGNPMGSAVIVPARTQRRWKARLGSAARQLVHMLADHDDEEVVLFARLAGFDGTRRDFVELFTATRALGIHGLEDIATAVHVLERGVRLM
jgi:hypothetical protein